MNVESTSLARVDSARAEWRRYLAFLRRPELPGKALGPGMSGFVGMSRMLAFDLALMLTMVGLVGLAYLMGADVPQTALSKVEFTPWLVVFVIFGAPISEEIAFRGWLSGRPGHVLATAIVLVSLVGAPVLALLLVKSGLQPLSPGSSLKLLSGVLYAAAAALAAYVLFRWRRRPPMAWFRRIFPALFWLSTLTFALVHLLNYSEDPSPYLMAFVIPQFVTGSILGYVRTRYGLWASISLHMLHNAAIMAVVLSGVGPG